MPLSDDLLQVKDRDQPDAKHLAYVPNAKVKPVEGSFMSYRDPYYYLWFSHGKCCHFENGFPDIGEEYVTFRSVWLMGNGSDENRYSIRVGRSKDVRGPFVDKNGRKLDHGGGTIIYGSNHGVVYAPGGVGVLSGNSTERDILYFHYCESFVILLDDADLIVNTTIGFLDRVSMQMRRGIY